MQFVLGNWEFSAHSDHPIRVGALRQPGLNGHRRRERRCRPNHLANGALPSDQRNVDNWIDSRAFQAIQNNPSQPNFTPNQINGNPVSAFSVPRECSTSISI